LDKEKGFMITSHQATDWLKGGLIEGSKKVSKCRWDSRRIRKELKQIENSTLLPVPSGKLQLLFCVDLITTIRTIGRMRKVILMFCWKRKLKICSFENGERFYYGSIPITNERRNKFLLTCSPC
jgi:hypothetical protein